MQPPTAVHGGSPKNCDSWLMPVGEFFTDIHHYHTSASDASHSHNTGLYFQLEEILGQRIQTKSLINQCPNIKEVTKTAAEII